MLKRLDVKRDVLPHLLAALFLLVLTLIYFSPLIFEDRTLPQHDVLQFKGASKEISDFRESTGKEPLWTNSMFGGMPSYLISTRYPGDLMEYVHKVFTLGLPPGAASLFLALLSGYLLLAIIGMDFLLALIGAIAIGFSTYTLAVIEAGHNTQSLAMAYMPLVIGGLIYTYRKTRWRNIMVGAIIFAVALSLQLRVNHVQITYYLGLMVIIYGIAEFIWSVKNGQIAPFLKKSALLLIGGLLAIGVSFGRLYTTAEYGKYSIRGKSELQAKNSGDKISEGLDRDYAFNWSYGIAESLTLLIPDFYGGASSHELGVKSAMGEALSNMNLGPEQVKEYLKNMPLYWGEQPFTSGPVYVGAISCFLFVLGLFLVDKKLRYWLLATTLFSLMLAWGANFEAFNYLMFDYFPGYNKFRSVTMALVIAQVAIPLLGLLGLSVYFNTPDSPELRRKLMWALGITGGICLLVALLAGTANFTGLQDAQLAKQGFPMDALKADRESAMRGDALRSLFFIAAAAGLMYFYQKRKLSRNLTLASIGLLVLVDMWTLDKRYINNDNFVKNYNETEFAPSPADQQILQDKSNYRVYNVQGGLTGDGRTSYFHKSIGGYHGAKLRRYQDVIEAHISKGNMQVLNMLNTKYIINQQGQVQQNPGALGNAWFVNSVRAVDSPDEELAALEKLNPAQEAVVDKSKFPTVQSQYSNSGATIRLTAYQPNHLTYEATTTQNGLAVFSEIYYADGWNAYIDGKKVDHLRANYILRALPIPAGKHTVEFKFEPTEYALGNTVAMISSIILLASLVGVIVLATRKGEENEEALEREHLVS